MFNFQGSELIIILLLALVVLGPEKLPEAMRSLGRFYADLKKMSTSFQDEFRAAVDEPVRELRDAANTLRDSADFQKFASGECEEKPKSADMADDTSSGAATDDTAADGVMTDGDPATEPTEDVPIERDAASESEVASNGDEAPQEEPPSPKPYPAPHPPFSSSQSISAAAPARPEPAAPSVDPPEPQVAVDDESGLREARPAVSSDPTDIGHEVAAGAERVEDVDR